MALSCVSFWRLWTANSFIQSKALGVVGPPNGVWDSRNPQTYLTRLVLLDLRFLGMEPVRVIARADSRFGLKPLIYSRPNGLGVHLHCTTFAYEMLPAECFLKLSQGTVLSNEGIGNGVNGKPNTLGTVTTNVEAVTGSESTDASLGHISS